MTRFARFVWGLLAYDLLVVAWGAYVRATGSGAGCGRHWPLCNGEVIPRSPPVRMLVELSHRATSGIALVLTVGLVAWGFASHPPGHVVRKGAGVALLLMGTEAAIGAGLVLLEHVAQDRSLARGVWVMLHLMNTFALLATVALTAWWTSGGAPLRLRGQRAAAVTVAVPLAAMLLVGASGAVTALGDTLFPPSSLGAGLAQDLAPHAHLFVRLRILHPLLAASTAALIVVACGLLRALRPVRAVRVLSHLTSTLALAQVAAGVLDVATLAPVALQLVHLLLADAVWIALVLTGAAALGQAPISSSNGPAPSSDVPPSSKIVAPVT